MKNSVKRIFVEKKDGFNVEARHLLKDLKQNIGIAELSNLRIIHRYDIETISDEIYNQARTTIFSEPPVDYVYDEVLEIDENAKSFAVEFLPGQYDQRADSASQCIQLLTHGDRPTVKYAKCVVMKGELNDQDITKVKQYMINPVESREATMEKPDSLIDEMLIPEDVSNIDEFIEMNDDQLAKLLKEMGFAMDMADIKFCQEYFRDTEKRNPSITEMKILDTYWSDHCRHTTFLTKIENVEFEDGKISEKIKETYEEYKKSREFVYGDRLKNKDECLMDIATIAVKELKKQGRLTGLDESEEINACSIQVTADIDGKDEEWLIMFKNETHNHP